MLLLCSGPALAGFAEGTAGGTKPPTPDRSSPHPGGWSWTEPPFGECWEDPTAQQLPACGDVRVPEELTIKLLFEFDEYIVPDTVVNRPVLATIDSYIRKVKRSPAREYVTIVGHTDAKGSDAYNMALGMRRAKAVRDYFIAEGYPAELLAPPESRGKRELLPQYSPFSVEQRRVVITKVDR
ncbi:MAG: OmpA family protein [Gammaproteobacteria bacterium]|jgi:OOP family OmpA-OmpF porin|nr:OmpA family protein [Gammaproteobacteria bacterium]